MTPEQIALLDQLKKMIFVKSKADEFIPIHLGIDWFSGTLWCDKMTDKDIRKIIIGEAISATQSKGDEWHKTLFL